MGIYVDTAYQHSAPEFPNGITLSKADFIWPSRQHVIGQYLTTQVAMTNNEIKVVISSSLNECTAIGSDL